MNYLLIIDYKLNQIDNIQYLFDKFNKQIN
jgi:hypothetical protein